MTKDDTVLILNMINASYPHFSKFMTDIERIAQLTVWQDQLNAYHKDDVAIAVKRHISKSKYPPTIAEIKENIKLIQRIKKARKQVESAKLLTSQSDNSIYSRLSEIDTRLEKINEKLKDKNISDDEMNNLKHERRELKFQSIYYHDELKRIKKRADEYLKRAEEAWKK